MSSFDSWPRAGQTQSLVACRIEASDEAELPPLAAASHPFAMRRRERPMVKIMLLLHRRQDLSVDEFRTYWHGQHRMLLERLPGLRRLVLNDVLPGPDGAPGPCDGISEDWFESPEAMQGAFASPEGQAVAADTPNFLDPALIQLVI